MLPPRYRINILLSIAICIILTLFALTSNFSLPDSTISVLSGLSPNSPEDTYVVSFSDIMRSPVSLSQDDPKLIKVIRSNYLKPPSDLPYNLNGRTDNPSMGQAKKIADILGPKKDGFFIEVGALDGETRSNTLVFEKSGWGGILIEGDPKNFDLLVTKHRKAWALSACLSTHPYPNMVLFKQNFNVGKITNLPLDQTKRRSGVVEVQCLPLYSILLALNTLSIDYFSLDVEGHELEVLKTIPWSKVNITTLSVEFIHGKEGKIGLQRYMVRQGYKVHSEVIRADGLANDLIFYHPELLNKKKGSKISIAR